jgi:hypothetical protein
MGLDFVPQVTILGGAGIFFYVVFCLRHRHLQIACRGYDFIG